MTAQSIEPTCGAEHGWKIHELQPTQTPVCNLHPKHEGEHQMLDVRTGGIAWRWPNPTF